MTITEFVIIYCFIILTVAFAIIITRLYIRLRENFLKFNDLFFKFVNMQNKITDGNLDLIEKICHEIGNHAEIIDEHEDILPVIGDIVSCLSDDA